MHSESNNQYELDVQWLFGEQGHITSGQLTLTSRADQSLQSIKLCLSGVVRIDDSTTLEGAKLVEHLSNYAVLKPGENSQWNSNQAWVITLGEPAYPMRHYSEGISCAYVCMQDGTTVDVAIIKTTAEQGATLFEPIDLSVSTQITPKYKSDTTQVNTSDSGWQLTPYPNHLVLSGAANAYSGLSFTPQGLSAQSAVTNFLAVCAVLYPEDQWYVPNVPLAINVSFDSDDDYLEEQYRIDFDKGYVTVIASAVTGYFYGLITLGQMMRAAVHYGASFPDSGEIEDQPAMQWRGCHLDVARQFYTVDSIERFLCILAWNKLNRFHWHLSDDEAWRIEVQAYPELTQIAAWRGHGRSIPPLLGSGAALSGGFYTQAQVRQIVQFAQQLGIVVVPELDMPGHCFAAIQGVPQLAEPDEPASYRSLQGFPNNCLNPVLAQTYEFVETIIDELAPLFPDNYWHVGADEVPDTAWHASPAVICASGDHVVNPGRHQAHFLRKIQSLLKQRNFITGAWQEGALNDGISAESSYLVAWLDTSAAKQLAARGYNVVVSAGQAYYLDMAMSDAWSEPGLGWAGSVSTQQTYRFDPTDGWDETIVSRCIGVQACIWSEQMTNDQVFDYLVFPRLSAVAETAWTKQENKNWDRFIKNSSAMPRLYKQ
jgi:hexosaminidase